MNDSINGLMELLMKTWICFMIKLNKAILETTSNIKKEAMVANNTNWYNKNR